MPTEPPASSTGAAPVDARGYLTEIARIYAQHGTVLELSPPSTEGSGDARFDALGLALPDWLRQLWRVADGGGAFSPVFTRPGFFIGADFLSLDAASSLRQRLRRIAGAYEGWEEPAPRDPRIRSGWFLDGWMPFASFGGSTMVLFADCAPAPGGEFGQVLSFVHDPDQISLVARNGTTYLAESLEWFDTIAEELLPDE